MTFFSIDQKKCKRDGICAAVCPVQIIVQEDKKSFPSLLEHGEGLCLNCGHCVAACPHGAITLAAMPISDCPPLEKDILPEAGALKQLLLSRRSIRHYKQTPVSRKLLADLLDVARYAPTGGNKQQVHWMVFSNRDDIHKLAQMVIDFMKIMIPLTTDEAAVQRFRRIISAWDNGRDRVLRGAPHLFIAHSPADLSFPASDCAIALTYLEIYAHAKGLGTCWAGYFTAAAGLHEPLMKTLSLPPGHQCFGAVMLGYPQYSYHRIPKRNPPQITWR